MDLSFNQNVRQGQNLEQSQSLSPQMQQSLRFLQMQSLEIRTELQNLMQENPLIENIVDPMERTLSTALPDEHASSEISERELDFATTSENMERTLACDDADRDYLFQNQERFGSQTVDHPYDPESQTRRDVFFDRQVCSETLQDHLASQIPLSDIPKEDQELAQILVGHIDDKGYFTGSIPDITMSTKASEQKILTLLAKIATFDPPGCGGRNLRECLLLQMDQLDDSPWENEVRILVDRHLQDVANHNQSFLCQELHLTPEEYSQVLRELQTLNPLPGNAFSVHDRSIYVRPEIFVSRNADGKWVVRVTDRDLPEIVISKKYLSLLEDPNSSSQTKAFIRDKLRAINTIQEAIDNRQTTIQKIAQAIVDEQPDVFEKGSLRVLKPLTMKRIADLTGVVDSTVSRTVKNKYMSTPFGTIELRRFFINGLTTASGETISSVHVKNRIQQIIASEDKSNPLSDDRISVLLKQEGIDAARRTVAKYRESLTIPSTSKRRVK